MPELSPAEMAILRLLYSAANGLDPSTVYVVRGKPKMRSSLTRSDFVVKCGKCRTTFQHFEAAMAYHRAQIGSALLVWRNGALEAL